MTVFAPEQPVTAEVLLATMRGDGHRKRRPQVTPGFVALDDGGNFGNAEARLGEHEWSCQVRPQCIAVEISAVKRIPRGRHGVTPERVAQVGSFGDRTPVEGHDRNAVGRKIRVPVGIAEWGDRTPLTVKIDRHPSWIGILVETLDPPEFPSGDDGGGESREILPSFKAAVSLDNL